MPRKPATAIVVDPTADWVTRERACALVEEETGLPVPPRTMEKWEIPRKIVFNTALVHVPSALKYVRNAIAEAPVSVQGELAKKSRNKLATAE